MTRRARFSSIERESSDQIRWGSLPLPGAGFPGLVAAGAAVAPVRGCSVEAGACGAALGEAAGAEAATGGWAEGGAPAAGAVGAATGGKFAGMGACTPGW